MNIHTEENANIEEFSDSLTTIEQLSNILTTIVEEGTDSLEEFWNSDSTQDAVATIKELGQSLGGAIKLLKAIKTLASVSDKLYLRKFDRLCKGISDIPLEKRQRLIKKIGHKKFKAESYFILNSINRIEEEEKIPFLNKLLEAQADGIIDLSEYRRLTILVDRTLYSDLLYLEHSITADPVALRTDSDFGLQASGLLVTAGTAWKSFEDESDPNDTGIRFNYTLSAKKLAQILFGVCCDNTPTNVDMIDIVPAQPLTKEIADRIWDKA